MFDGRGDRKYLNGAERRAFLKAVNREPDYLRRTFALTLFYTGCRISEALNLSVDRIDTTDGNFVFETLKRRQRGIFRAVPIPDDLATIRQQPVSSKVACRVWPFSRATGYRLIKDFMLLAGITGTKASPKGLRHSFAIACIEQNIPLTVIKKWMGHARLETTEIYLAITGEEEKHMASRLWI